MTELLAYTLVVLAAIYLLWLGVVSFLRPAYAANFLNGFASSARAHYLEISLRLVVGTAMVLASSRLQFSSAFHLFGWVLVLSSVVLLLIPWQWHHRFA